MCVARFLTSGLMPIVLLRVLLDDLEQFYCLHMTDFLSLRGSLRNIP